MFQWKVSVHTQEQHYLSSDRRYQEYKRKIFLFFTVSLTVHLSITLANDQLDAQIFNKFITILYVYMFRAISCSSSGGQIVLTQHLVSSLRKQVSCLKLLQYNAANYIIVTLDNSLVFRVMIPDAVLIQFDVLGWWWARHCSKHVHIEDCNKCIKNLCIKLVIS